VYESPLPLAQVAPGVAPAIVDAVHRALAKKQDERFANVNELVEALTGKPLPERRATSTPPSLDGSSPSSRRRTGSRDDDAFAQTMGSGDHADSVAPVHGSSPTVDSQNLPITQSPTARASRSRLPLFISFAGVAVALGVAMLYLKARGPDDALREPMAASERSPSPPTPVEVAAAQPAPATQPDPAPPAL